MLSSLTVDTQLVLQVEVACSRSLVENHFCVYCVAAVVAVAVCVVYGPVVAVRIVDAVSAAVVLHVVFVFVVAVAVAVARAVE